MADLAATTGPSIYTYHCLCTNLVIATTYTLSALLQRAKPSLDSAYILPCPGPQLEAAEVDPHNFEDVPAGKDHTFVLSLSADKPSMIRREDGFEKRWLLRCQRCKLVVGYQLDGAQSEQENEEAMTGRRGDVMYVLQGALSTTAEMKSGSSAARE